MPWSNQGGGPWGSGKGPWGSGPQSSGPTPPDLEELLRRSQDKLRTVLPGGSFGGRRFALIALAVLALWGFSGFFRVEPDELGVVLRFGKYVRDVQPGLNYHLPYPIESALTPKALRVNKIDVGIRLVEDISRSTTMREAPEESLMLTGDENIVDVEFSVFWLVKPGGVSDYLFNIQNPEGTVKAVAESAMREVIGRSQIQPILTGARQTIEGGVQDLRGRMAQITQPAEAYREQTVAEATGQASRFLKIYDQYKIAPEVTRQRMYLETMERLFGGTDKIIVDTSKNAGASGVVPYLPLNELQHRPQTQTPQTGGSK